VTLEPCSFHQRTPSCAKGMIARRIGTVYVATLDPHPRNQGRGIAMLQEAGVLGARGDGRARSRSAGVFRRLPPQRRLGTAGGLVRISCR
jgi:pyrimidine deaminase RibD-like protein